MARGLSWTGVQLPSSSAHLPPCRSATTGIHTPSAFLLAYPVFFVSLSSPSVLVLSCPVKVQMLEAYLFGGLPSRRPEVLRPRCKRVRRKHGVARRAIFRLPIRMEFIVLLSVFSFLFFFIFEAFLLFTSPSLIHCFPNGLQSAVQRRWLIKRLRLLAGGVQNLVRREGDDVKIASRSPLSWVATICARARKAIGALSWLQSPACPVRYVETHSEVLEAIGLANLSLRTF